MAVTKLWSVTERLGQVIDYATNPEKTSANIKREFSPEQYQALADVIAYAKDEEKTEREFYIDWETLLGRCTGVERIRVTGIDREDDGTWLN